VPDIIPATVNELDGWLEAETARFSEGAYAVNTKRAYHSDWALFVAWCIDRQLQVMPADPRVVVVYLGWLKDQGLKWSSIDRRAVSIGQAHRTLGHPSPLEHPKVKVARRAIMNDLGTGNQRRVKGILPANLAEWLPQLPDTPHGHRDAAMFTMGLGGALRRSELAALRLEDISVEDRGMVIRIAKSKTDQAGHGAEVWIWRGASDVTCPTVRWLAWLSDISVDPLPNDAPAFRAFRGVHMLTRGISGRVVAEAVKRLVRLNGKDPAEYSGHSLRAGFVTAADKARKTEAQIMRQTRHKSRDMLDRYIRPETGWTDNPSEGIGL